MFIYWDFSCNQIESILKYLGLINKLYEVDGGDSEELIMEANP